MSVSVIVPCYNVSPYLDACLESLSSQTLRSLEIICVDDGSTDETPVLLDGWARQDTRIRVIRRENGGPGAARNSGMDAATGEYIGFVDPDDYVEPSMYARLLEEARRQDADVTACGYTSFSHRDGSVLEELSCSPVAGVEKKVQSAVFHPGAVWERMGVMTCNKLYKREFLNKYSLRFEASFRSAEDDVLWLMVLAHAGCLAVIPDRLYWYRRQREGSVSHMLWEGEHTLLMMERLLHVTAYWKATGWMQTGLELGWVALALRNYLLGGLLSSQHPLPQLDEREWKLFHDRCREWFSLVGNVEAFRSLGKWDFACCRLLSHSPEHAGLLSRSWWKFLSRCHGRRGRYYEIRCRLSLPAGRSGMRQDKS